MFEGNIRRSLSRTVLLPAMNVLILASIASGQISGCPSSNSNVTTWHNDNCRTGWQYYETQLTQSQVQNNFGLLWQWQLPANYDGVPDQVYAQPLAIAGLSNVGTCTNNCNVVFIATEQDMLYAFRADSNSQTALWSTNLAGQNDTPVDCTDLNPPCGSGVIYPFIGVTGTPAISTTNNTTANVLYVVSAVSPSNDDATALYYLHAIDITTGKDLVTPQEIQGTFPGSAPSQNCATSTTTGIYVNFDPLHHIQRAGLLLVTVNGTDIIYIAFAPVRGEIQNGWIFGYSYTSSGFTQVAQFVTTPYGTGGGIWGSGAGPASDGDYIYMTTGNGTFDVSGVPNTSTDYGDSMLKLAIGTSGSLSVTDYFTPSDVFSYGGNTGLCINDEDFGSGGVMLFPDSFYPGYSDLMINGDKQSNFYVVDRGSLGGVGGQLQQTMQPSNAPTGSEPGYWSNPAYWKSGSSGSYQYQIYYAPDNQNTDQSGMPLDMYILGTSSSGTPIPSAPSANTANGFCADAHAPTPSISSDGTTQTSGIVWAIESSNKSSTTCLEKNVGPAVLRAYNATPSQGVLSQLYTSGNLSHKPGGAVNFPVPTIFNGRVYMGTKAEVDVFGICPPSPGACLN